MAELKYRYIVQAFIDEDAHKNTINKYTGKREYSPIKGWDGKSPLYGAGNGYSLRLTPDILMAKSYGNEENARYYCDCIAGNGTYTILQLLINTAIRI